MHFLLHVEFSSEKVCRAESTNKCYYS